MALTGMFAWQGWAYEVGGSTYTAKWDFVLPDPPVKGFAQLSLGDYTESDDQSAAECAIVRIYHRPVSGPDTHTDFDEAGESDATRIAYDDRLHRILVHQQLHNCAATILLQVFVFG
jgi:hypothetical protein